VDSYDLVTHLDGLKVGRKYFILATMRLISFIGNPALARWLNFWWACFTKIQLTAHFATITLTLVTSQCSNIHLLSCTLLLLFYDYDDDDDDDLSIIFTARRNAACMALNGTPVCTKSDFW